MNDKERMSYLCTGLAIVITSLIVLLIIGLVAWGMGY